METITKQLKLPIFSNIDKLRDSIATAVYYDSSVSCNQAFTMVVINFMNITSIFKKLTQAVLFVAFLYMTVRALIDVFSFRTTLIVTKEHRNITFLPAFSVCDNYAYALKGYDKKNLANGSMVIQSFAGNFKVRISVDEGNGVTSSTNINLMDNIDIQNELDDVNLLDLWTLQCKPFSKGKSHCMPCITFNGARFKKEQSIEYAMVNSLKIQYTSVFLSASYSCSRFYIFKILLFFFFFSIFLQFA